MGMSERVRVGKMKQNILVKVPITVTKWLLVSLMINNLLFVYLILEMVAKK